MATAYQRVPTNSSVQLTDPTQDQLTIAQRQLIEYNNSNSEEKERERKEKQINNAIKDVLANLDKEIKMYNRSYVVTEFYGSKEILEEVAQRLRNRPYGYFVRTRYGTVLPEKYIYVYLRKEDYDKDAGIWEKLKNLF